MGTTAALFCWVQGVTQDPALSEPLLPILSVQPGNAEFLRLGFIKQVTVLSAVCMLYAIPMERRGCPRGWGDPSAQAGVPWKRRSFSSPGL